MKQRSHIQNQQMDQLLDQLEEEFRSLLVPTLTDCAGGRSGLFGQNDRGDYSKNLYWLEAEQLKDVARDIYTLRAEFGQPNPLVERFLHYCSLLGSNIPGEPKLAQALLKEIESGLE